MSKKIKNKKLSKLSDFINENIFVILAFVCSAALMMIVYFCFDMIPFGDRTVLRMDLFHQYGPMFAELYDRITNFKSLIFSWTSGGGNAFLGNYFNYMSSPIALIILFFGHENIPESIGAMVLIKNALASAAMAYYLKKAHSKNDFSITAFGILYSFCGFFIAYYWNVMWIDAMYLLPLITLGIEKIINKRKPALYTVSLAIAFFSNYYMAFMICVFSVLYFFVYYFSNYAGADMLSEPAVYTNKNGKTLRKKSDCIKNSHIVRSGLVFAAASIVSAALMAVALIPTFLILKDCSATSGNMPEELNNYNSIFDFLANHLASVTPTIRSGDAIPNVYCGILTLVLMPLYYICRKISVKEKVATTLLLGLFFFAFNFNIPNYIIHAFHFPNDLPFRFSFIYSFFLLITAYKVILNISDFTGKEIFTSSMALIVFIIIVEKTEQINVTITSVAISIIMAAVYATVLWLLKNPKYYQSTVSLLLLCCVFAEAAVANTDNFEITQQKPNFVNGYSQFRVLKEDLDETEGGNNYRMELTDLNTLMDNCWFGYNGTSLFTSMAYERYANMQEDIGIKGNYINSYMYNKNTPVYNALMSLKYIVNNNDSVMDEDYYAYYSSSGSFEAYKNKYYLPLAFGVDDDIINWDSTLHSDPFRCQSDFWELSTGVGDVFEPIPLNGTELENINEAASMLNGTMLNYTKETGKQDAKIYASYLIDEDGHYYSYVDAKQLESASVSCGDFSETQDLSEPYILDVGYHNKGEIINVEIPIKADEPSNGTIYSYVYKINHDAFEEGYKKLSANGLVQKTFTDTSFGGTVNIDTDCVLLTSVPYSKGWTVTIDGEKAVAYGVDNDALLAVNITAGEHDVEFRYHARGLLLGSCISGATILAIILFFVLRKLIYKHKDKKSAVYISPQQPEKNEITGIEALMEQDLGPNATPEDYEALLAEERELTFEENDEQNDAEIADEIISEDYEPAEKEIEEINDTESESDTAAEDQNEDNENDSPEESVQSDEEQYEATADEDEIPEQNEKDDESNGIVPQENE